MGYRGEDVPAAHGDWERQQPWQQSSGVAPGSAGAWDDGSQGYGGDVGYPPGDGGGFGYGQGGDYPGHGQQGFGPQDGQYGDPYGQQQPYEPYGGGYGPEPGQGGYAGPHGFSQDDYGYEPSSGYGGPTTGYEPGGYEPPPASDYGYPDPNTGYGQPSGYPGPSADGYAAPPPGTGGYPPLPGGSGGYPAPPGGTGGYPAEDAGNDWYGGQPAAAKGASFADTGTYALNGRVIDEYGTGPRGALRDPVRGYPPGPGQQGSGPLPMPGPSALPASHASPRTGSQSVAETRGQERLYEEPAAGPGRTQGGFPGSTSDGFQDAGATQTFDGRGGYEYQDEFHGLGAAGDLDQERYDGAAGPEATDGAGGRANRARGGRAGRGPLGGKRLLFAALGVIAVGIIGTAGYVFVLNPGSPASNASAQGPLPTGSAQPSQQACVKELGTYCHIETATDDPVPLSVAEVFPPAFTNETDKISYTLVSTKLDKKCANAVIGQNLTKTLQAGKCTQVLRASYVSGNGKIMGTIGVVNLATTNEAHYAGRVIGKNDFIAPLTSAKGVASKLGNGTGVVEAEFKGHYLLLTWSEYVNGTTPTTKAQDNQLEQFSSDLVAGTANIALTQRMVTGAPASLGAAS